VKDVKKAEDRLAVLDKACRGTFSEYMELKDRITKFKSQS
jgi:hypothetical protein